MTNKQLEGIKESCRKIHSLCYTHKYSVTKQDYTKLENGDYKVTFEIRREEKHPKTKQIVFTYQTGTIYVSTKGKLYWYNFMGNKRDITLIGYVVTGFKLKEI